MARRPNAASPVGLPVSRLAKNAAAESEASGGIHRGRKVKAAGSTKPSKVVKRSPQGAGPTNVVGLHGDAAAAPARERLSRKPKAMDETIKSSAPSQPAKPAKTPSSRKPRHAAPMAEPPTVSHTTVAGPSLQAAEPTEVSTPAVQWNRATDMVRFDWAAIENTASQGGPNQGMAKLLIAARAQGANSRWPL